jgi:hypothetical protein
MSDYETTNALRDSLFLIEAQQREIDRLREALLALWTGTIWGAAKGAVYEAHRRTMKTAGIDDIGD